MQMQKWLAGKGGSTRVPVSGAVSFDGLWFNEQPIVLQGPTMAGATDAD
jgi:hypothetical protein